MTIITGTSLADTIEGGFEDDTINGLGGSDVIDGQAGSDIIDGGEDIDTCKIIDEQNNDIIIKCESNSLEKLLNRII